METEKSSYISTSVVGDQICLAYSGMRLKFVETNIYKAFLSVSGDEDDDEDDDGDYQFTS